MPETRENITVIKYYPGGREAWRYDGRVLARGADFVLLEAPFQRDHDLLFNGVLLRRGDRFLELYYTHKGYNIYEIRDQDDDRIKAWYCNVCEPALISDGTVSFVDLALDLFVIPGGPALLLDEDEFEDLPPSPELRQRAAEIVDELRGLDLGAELRSYLNPDRPA